MEECIDEADIEEDSDDIEDSAPDKCSFQDEVEHDVFAHLPKYWDNISADMMLHVLSQKLATFLRYDAIELGWQDGEGWVEVAHACSRLSCTAAQVANVVQRSSRGTDQWGLGPRFEMWIAGPQTWIRAPDGDYYRQRAQRNRRKAIGEAS